MQKNIEGLLVLLLICLMISPAFAQARRRRPLARLLGPQSTPAGDLSNYPVTLQCPPEVHDQPINLPEPWGKYGVTSTIAKGVDHVEVADHSQIKPGTDAIACVYNPPIPLHREIYTLVPTGNCVVGPDGRSFRCKR